ncbi:MAG: inositol monophosphatase [Candidatus Eremiobacteraeota bacterium]|nr:inositol monophosphatase [Candidatus Eremiobacteraeota bacterium]
MEPLNLALECAREAGALLLEYFGRHLAFEEKSRRADLVTVADRASEALIVERIRKASPHATIVGEESGVHAGSSTERWFIDPLDGTTNFAHTYPLFCVSIGCEIGGELVAGVVFAPKLGELYAAERGSGARLGDEPIRVSDVERVADALLCTGFTPAEFAINMPHFQALSGVAHAVRRDGAAALDLAFTACGRFEAFWEFGLSPWDVAAGSLIVREAGGAVTAADGGAFDPYCRSILATNGKVHGEMRELLSRQPSPLPIARPQL